MKPNIEYIKKEMELHKWTGSRLAMKMGVSRMEVLEAQAIGTEGGASAPTKPEDSRRLSQGCTQHREEVMGEAEVGADG